MTKVALITDQHFGARGDAEVMHTHFQRFYDNVFFPYLKENDIDTVVDLGDTFDRRKFINFVSLKRCREYWFDPIRENNINLHLIVGNHCTSYKNTNEVNSPDLLLGEYDIGVYSSPTEIDILGHKIVMVPWICDDNREQALDIIEKSNADILLGHLELDGFEMHRGQPHHGGMEANVFSKFHLVLSGHFHHRSTSRNITYLGCPYEMSWSDYNDPKGFHVLDLETKELTFIENPYKLFHKVKYDDNKWKDSDQLKSFDFSYLKDSYVKVIVINKTNPYWFDLFVDKIEKENPIQVQVVDDNLNLDLVDDEDILENVDDTLTILHNSIDTMATDVDKKRLDNLFKSLYSSALDIG